MQRGKLYTLYHDGIPVGMILHDRPYLDEQGSRGLILYHEENRSILTGDDKGKYMQEGCFSTNIDIVGSEAELIPSTMEHIDYFISFYQVKAKNLEAGHIANKYYNGNANWRRKDMLVASENTLEQIIENKYAT